MPVIVRTGNHGMQAILFKDTFGQIQSFLRGVPAYMTVMPPPAGSNVFAQFLAASMGIIEADTDSNFGKISFQFNPITALSFVLV
jgi:hypothetical protein